jgi:hypothetical protein
MPGTISLNADVPLGQPGSSAGLLGSLIPRRSNSPVGARARRYRTAVPTITVLIDSPPTAPYHRATIAALRHAIELREDRDAFVLDVVNTDRVGALGDAVVIGPGTPYNAPKAAEDVIRTARERGVPLVAT